MAEATEEVQDDVSNATENGSRLSGLASRNTLMPALS